MPENIEVTSPTKEIPGDAKGKESNLTVGQAAAQLFAQAEKAEQKQQAQTAMEVKLPEQSEAPPETPVAETTQVSAETPAEVTPPAETTQAPEPPEEGAEAVHSQKSSFTPEQQEIFNKRLGKEVAKTKAIEAQMEAAKSRLAELEAKLSQPAEPAVPAPVVVLGNQPLPDVNDFAALQKMHQSAKEAVRFVEETLDNPRAWKKQTVTDPDTGDEVEVKFTTIGKDNYTEADLKASARRAKVTLEDHIPQRAEFLKARVTAQEMAAAEFPWLKDKSSPEYQMAQAARRDPGNAAIMAQPNADWIIGVQIEGRKAMEARKAAAKAPPPKPKAPAPKPANDQTVVSTSTATTRQPIGGAERQALEAERVRLSKKGGITAEDAVKFLQQSEALRKSR
jgi:hypothetical protein